MWVKFDSLFERILMSSPTIENLLNPRRFKKEKSVLDLNDHPPMVSYENDQTLSENVIPKISANCSNGLKASVNMVEGILTLVQHQGHEEEHDERPQGMRKRGLRTSWTVHYVHGNFDLPTECVNYILVRDKYRQRLSRSSGRMFRSLVEVEKFIKYEMYPPKPRRLSKNSTKSTIITNL
ncbi:hypothetical protein L1987_59902 [Smallanthus sonchifolius]|uniref:Uncharacterized protein n=1 Tax=Smallanthus sonchifolius TaxID=185202 RepID=A0ACB9D6M0_9ASTR|nr:hypothetical protein L1987_59902 [Smallanthus sonchifolius]